MHGGANTGSGATVAATTTGRSRGRFADATQVIGREGHEACSVMGYMGAETGSKQRHGVHGRNRKHATRLSTWEEQEALSAKHSDIISPFLRCSSLWCAIVVCMCQQVLDAASSMIKVADACSAMGCMDDAGAMFGKARGLLEDLKGHCGWESSGECATVDGVGGDARRKCEKLLKLIAEQLATPA